MRILITAGPTREPIDAVRYLGNRSSGQMGAALATAALAAGHETTVVVGPVSVGFPQGLTRIDVETAAQMQEAVLSAFPSYDLLVMAAAVADFRPVYIDPQKLSRTGQLTIVCEPTEDIVGAVGAVKRASQRTVGFSLEANPDLGRAREKLARKRLDLIVYNPLRTMGSPDVEATLLWADGREELLAPRSKGAFAETLLSRAAALFDRAPNDT